MNGLQPVRAEVEENRLLRAFLEEAEELLEGLNQTLVALEKDKANRGLIHEVFRLTHSIKSEAALLGLANTAELAHRLEDVFERLRSGSTVLDGPLMDAVFAASDLLHEAVARIGSGEGDSAVDSRTVLAELQRIAGPEEGGEPRPAPAPEAGQGPEEERPGPFGLKAVQMRHLEEAADRGEEFYSLEFEVDPEAVMMYPRAYLVSNNLEIIANVVRTVPDLESPSENDRDYARVQVLLTAATGEAELRRACQVDQVQALELRRLDPGELMAPRPAPPTPAGSQEPAGSRPERSSVRVDTRKLNDLWHLVGELTACKARLSALAQSFAEDGADRERFRSRLERSTDTLERITAAMQHAMMETRMVPISVLFNKFPRLVRDLSRKLGKSVELFLYGRETEIDRSLVEALSDPLTHVIRNALDHGIEPAAERGRAGKAEQGRIAISAQQQGGRIVIEVYDDGRGIDFDRIRQKVGDSAASDQELIRHIFSPGFSTRDDVTDLSGRGVGMDVVATRIREDLRGEIAVQSTRGAGTTVTIFLPLTLTILDALVAGCGEGLFGIPVRDIVETTRVDRAHVEVVEGGERYHYNDHSIPLLKLWSLLPRLAAPDRSDAEGHNGVVISQRDREIVLLVDELVDEEDVVVRPLSGMLNAGGLFSGASVMGDGRILFLLDTARLVSLAGVGSRVMN